VYTQYFVICIVQPVTITYMDTGYTCDLNKYIKYIRSSANDVIFQKMFK